MSKIQWKHGENTCQQYYDAHVGKDYLCVYENKWNPGVWAGMYELEGGGIQSIWDKTSNDRQRRRQGLPLGCPMEKLSRVTMLCNASPEYMMKKVEHCYRRRKTEVCY